MKIKASYLDGTGGRIFGVILTFVPLNGEIYCAFAPLNGEIHCAFAPFAHGNNGDSMIKVLNARDLRYDE